MYSILSTEYQASKTKMSLIVQAYAGGTGKLSEAVGQTSKNAFIFDLLSFVKMNVGLGLTAAGTSQFRFGTFCKNFNSTSYTCIKLKFMAYSHFSMYF